METLISLFVLSFPFFESLNDRHTSRGNEAWFLRISRRRLNDFRINVMVGARVFRAVARTFFF